MTDEQKRILNEKLCEALEPKPIKTYRGDEHVWWEWESDDLVPQLAQWIPRYEFFSDGNAMLKLVDEMRMRKWWWSGEEISDDFFRVKFSRPNGYTDRDWRGGDSLPEATALAALQALDFGNTRVFKVS